MPTKHVLIACCTLLCISTLAGASSLTLNANGTAISAFQGQNPVNGTLTGTITFDTNTFQAISENIKLNFSNGGTSFNASSIPVVTSIPPSTAAATNYTYEKNGVTTVQVLDTLDMLNIHALNFSVKDSLLTSYFGDPMISPIVIGQNTEQIYTITGGTLTDPNAVPPVASTPEPSSLILLGTGVLGIVGAVRRRVFKT